MNSAGFRRLQAVKAMGWETVPCVIADNLDDAYLALRAEYSENVCREAMSPSEMVEAGRALEALEREKARGRKGGRPRKDQETSGKLPEVSTGDTRDKVASSLGVSGKTYEKGKQVVEAAQEQPELFGDLPAMMDQQSIDAAHKELRRRQEPAPASDGIASPRQDAHCLPVDSQPVARVTGRE